MADGESAQEGIVNPVISGSVFTGDAMSVEEMKVTDRRAMSVLADEPRTAPVVVANPMQMLASAVQQGMPMETIRELMAFKKEWEADEARKAFNDAIASAKAEIKPIVKKREVDFANKSGGRTSYSFEAFSDIAEHVDPILAKYGLSYRHRPRQEGNRLTVTCILSHRAGHFEEVSLSANNDESGNKNSIQAVGSTSSYLQRYTLKLALGLSAALDDDGQKSGTEFITEKQAIDLQAKAEEVGVNKENFLRFLKVERLADLPAKKYSAAIQALNDKARGVR